MALTEAERELMITAEANLLGSLLICGTDGTDEALCIVKKIVTPEDFYPYYKAGMHKRIYEGMIRAGKTDQLSVANAMAEAGTLQSSSENSGWYGDIGNMSLMIADVFGIDYEHFAHLVADYSKKLRGDQRKAPDRPRYQIK